MSRRKGNGIPRTNEAHRALGAAVIEQRVRENHAACHVLLRRVMEAQTGEELIDKVWEAIGTAFCSGMGSAGASGEQVTFAIELFRSSVPPRSGEKPRRKWWKR